MLVPGIYENLSNEVYHSSKAISRSMLMELEKSTLHYWQQYESPSPVKKETTDSMNIGSAIHCLILEPDEFDKRFFIKLKVDGRTKAGKEYNSQIEELALGKIILDEKQEELVYTCANEISSHKDFPIIIDRAKTEISLFWEDKDTGILCKARPDIWNDRINVLCDLKNTANSLENAFYYSAIEGGYDIQAAMQVDAIYELTGVSITSFYFIVPQTQAPHKPFIYRMPIEVIEAGRAAYKRGLRLLKACKERNKWGLERERVITLDPYRFIKARERSFSVLAEIYECQI